MISTRYFITRSGVDMETTFDSIKKLLADIEQMVYLKRVVFDQETKSRCLYFDVYFPY